MDHLAEPAKFRQLLALYSLADGRRQVRGTAIWASNGVRYLGEGKWEVIDKTTTGTPHIVSKPTPFTKAACDCLDFEGGNRCKHICAVICWMLEGEE